MLTVTLEYLRQIIETKPLTEARAEFAEYSPTIRTTGKVLKKITREPGNIRLYVQTTEPSCRPFEIFANFPLFAEQAKIESAKIKKGSSVQITGNLKSFGEIAIVLTNCRLHTEKPPAKKVIKKPAKARAKKPAKPSRLII